MIVVDSVLSLTVDADFLCCSVVPVGTIETRCNGADCGVFVLELNANGVALPIEEGVGVLVAG